MRQSFDSENFVKIFYQANKKGFFIERYYYETFKPVNRITDVILYINKNFKSGAYKDDAKKDKANEVKERLIEKKHYKLIEILSKLEQNIENKGIDFSINNSTQRKGKIVYTITKNKQKPEEYFALKQVQKNIKNSFKISQPDRYEITSQVINMLDNDFPKFVIRTDIKSFFETISHNKLQEKIKKNHILNTESKNIINKILEQYSVLSNSDKGIPRGIGISSNLSELYMRDIDNKIKALDNLTYYARYVDDIILVFTPNTKYDKVCYLSKIEEIIKGEDLQLNCSKTRTFDLLKNSDITLDFLGYKISKGNKEIHISITMSKIDKYKAKIDKAIESYNETNNYNEKLARKLLRNRIRYLTGNTRLLGVKKDILIGIYFSNILLTDSSSLGELDKYLRCRLNSLKPHPRAGILTDDLANKLKKYDFQEGFKKIIFYKFDKNTLKDILKVWK